MIEILENARTIGVVHTHTQCNLINNKESIENALFNMNFFETDRLIM